MDTALSLMEMKEPVYPLDIVQAMRDQRACMIQNAVSIQFKIFFTYLRIKRLFISNFYRASIVLYVNAFMLLTQKCLLIIHLQTESTKVEQ